jgi:hypothetical protein
MRSTQEIHSRSIESLCPGGVAIAQSTARSDADNRHFRARADLRGNLGAFVAIMLFGRMLTFFRPLYIPS